MRNWRSSLRTETIPQEFPRLEGVFPTETNSPSTGKTKEKSGFTWVKKPSTITKILFSWRRI